MEASRGSYGSEEVPFRVKLASPTRTHVSTQEGKLLRMNLTIKEVSRGQLEILTREAAGLHQVVAAHNLNAAQHQPWWVFWR